MLNRIKIWENNFRHKLLGHEDIILPWRHYDLLRFLFYLLETLRMELGPWSTFFLVYFHGHSTQVRLKSLERTKTCLNEQRLLNGKCFNSLTS